jgi:hypothetical protein
MLNIKAGFKSLEYYLGAGAIVAKMIWNDFPDEAFGTIIAYVIARQGQKAFGLFDETTQKASWQTSEFWATLIFSITKSIFPNMPEESMIMVLSWIGGRTGLKGIAAYKSYKNIPTVSSPPVN